MKGEKIFVGGYKPDLGESWLLAILMLAGSVAVGLAIPGCKVQSISYFLSMMVPFLYIGYRACRSGVKSNSENTTAFPQPGWAVVLVCAISVLCISVVLEPLMSLIPMPEAFKEMFRKVFYDTPLWDMVLCSCILAPILEETLCRGIMLRGMLSHRSAKSAIVWSALIFAVMHANPWQAIPAFAIGVFFAWMYVRTGSLRLTIFLHFVNNSAAAISSRMMPQLDVDQGLMDIMGGYFYILLAFCAIILFFSIKYLNEKTISNKIHAHS